jgi:hypothetical protein
MGAFNMENERTVTLTLTESQYGKLFSAYLCFVDDVLESSNLSDEDKRLEIESLQDVGLVLWSAVPAFLPVHDSLRLLNQIGWDYHHESKE